MKHTKKIISIISTISLISAMTMALTACGKSSKTKSTDTATPDKCRIVSFYESADYDNNICFAVQENGRLDFVDMTTLEDSPVCDDPSCKHREGSDCTAYEKNNHPFIYDKKLYYIKSSDITTQEDGTYTTSTYFYSSDINGANEKQLAEIKGLSYNNFDRMALIGDTAYMIMTDQPYDKDFKELEPSMKLVSVSLGDGKVCDLGEVTKGYSCGAWVYGLWDSKLIFRTSKAADNRPFMERLQDFAEKNGLSENEALEQYTDKAEYTYEYLAYDIKAQKLDKLDKLTLPDPLAISDNCYYYAKDGKPCYLDKSDKEQTIQSSDNITNITNITNISAINGYALIDTDSEEYLFNESDKTLSKLSDQYDIAAIKDGQAIIRTGDTPMYKTKALGEM